jgi:hypothetical protein
LENLVNFDWIYRGEVVLVLDLVRLRRIWNVATYPKFFS